MGGFLGGLIRAGVSMAAGAEKGAVEGDQLRRQNAADDARQQLAMLALANAKAEREKRDAEDAYGGFTRAHPGPSPDGSPGDPFDTSVPPGQVMLPASYKPGTSQAAIDAATIVAKKHSNRLEEIREQTEWHDRVPSHLRAAGSVIDPTRRATKENLGAVHQQLASDERELHEAEKNAPNEMDPTYLMAGPNGRAQFQKDSVIYERGVLKPLRDKRDRSKFVTDSLTGALVHQPPGRIPAGASGTPTPNFPAHPTPGVSWGQPGPTPSRQQAPAAPHLDAQKAAAMQQEYDDEAGKAKRLAASGIPDDQVRAAYEASVKAIARKYGVLGQ
jgi:hypothetical protein